MNFPHKFPKKIRKPRKISPILPFLVIPTNFLFSRYFSVSIHFLKFFFSPTFANLPLDFVTFTCFLYTLRVFRFPLTFTMMHIYMYASHKSRTGRPCRLQLFKFKKSSQGLL